MTDVVGAPVAYRPFAPYADPTGSRRRPSPEEIEPTTDLSLDDIVLGDLDVWMRADRDGIFKKLRDEAPMSFHPEPEYLDPQTGEQVMAEGPGFWLAVRYADVLQVSRDPETFHSAPSINITDIPPELGEWLGSMINMDAPKHTKLRDRKSVV